MCCSGSAVNERDLGTKSMHRRGHSPVGHAQSNLSEALSGRSNSIRVMPFVYEQLSIFTLLSASVLPKPASGQTPVFCGYRGWAMTEKSRGLRHSVVACRGRGAITAVMPGKDRTHVTGSCYGRPPRNSDTHRSWGTK